MLCPKWGYRNDDDAEFCEKCGSILKSTAYNSGTSNSEGMKTSTKVLLIAVVVLVAALGLTVGLLIGNNNHPTVNATNNTTPTVNNTTINQSQSVENTTKESSNGMITSRQAANIALNYAGDGWSIGSVDFVPAANYKNTPNYMVELVNEGTIEEAQANPNAPLKTATSMDVRVNANTGAIME